MPIQYQHFAVSVILAVLFPLAPLAIDLIFEGSIGAGSILISSFMYIVGISLQSKSPLIMILGFICSSSLAMGYGHFVAQRELSNFSYYIAIFVTFCFAVVHIRERWTLHVVARQNFLEIEHNG